METIREIFAKNFDKERKNKGIFTIAYESGYSPSNLTRLLSGKQTPRLRTALSIAQALDVSLDSLVEHCGQRYYSEQTTIGARFKELRKKKKITLSKLQELTGVHLNLMSRFETERLDMSLENILKIAKVLDFSLDWLCGR